MSSNNDISTGTIVLFLVCLFLLLTTGIGGCLYVEPQYRVYSQRLSGEAQLAHAQASKEIAVAEAKAKMESAELLSQAEVIRAEGVAKANKIIGSSLKDNPEYLKYLWLTNIDHNTDKTVIYIPTEANIPLLETSRLLK